VVQAILRIGGPINSGGINTANITGTLINPGFGFLSPTLCSIVRQTPCGGQVVIRVDLNRALRDPRERILIQPKDLLVLQERPDEAITRYITEQFKFSFLYRLVDNAHAMVQGVGATTGTPPTVP